MAAKQKIVVTVTNDLVQDQRMHRICTSLDDAGYEVILIGRQRKNSLSLVEMPFQQRHLRCFFNRGALFYLEYNIRLFVYFLTNRFDVAYAVDLDTLGGAGAASQLRRKKLIFDAHEYFTEVPELEGKRFKKWIWYHIGLWFVDYASLNITVNQELAIILAEKYKKPFEVVQSVPFLHKAESESKKEKILLYQGVLNKGRGLEQAIDAMSHLSNEYTLHIVGSGDIEAALHKRVMEKGLEDRVRFLGWLKPKALKTQTSKAFIGLNLLNGTSLNYKYSLANKFFDYMHAGVPSLNMEFPAYKRILRKNKVGEMVSELSPTLIASTIEYMSNTKRYKAYIDACTTARIDFSWQNESTHLVRLIEKVVPAE